MLYAQHMSEIHTGHFRILGRSVAGESTAIVVPEFDCMFDIGCLPPKAFAIGTLFLSHGHFDHAGCLPSFLSYRMMHAGDKSIRIVAPCEIVGLVSDLVDSWQRLSGREVKVMYEGIEPGAEVPVRQGLACRAFKTDHDVSSVGFVVVELRNKLKPEFARLSGPELVDLKRRGVQIQIQTEHPLLAYIGETSRANYSDNASVAQASVLLVECTFFDPDDVDRAASTGHLHVAELGHVLEGMQNRHVILMHKTQKTHMKEASKIMRGHLSPELLSRISLLMGRKYATRSPS